MEDFRLGKEQGATQRSQGGAEGREEEEPGKVESGAQRLGRRVHELEKGTQSSW